MFIGSTNAQIQVINVTSAWSSGAIQCASSGITECIINCLVSRACGCSGSFYCGAEVHCSSGPSIPCTINCKGASTTCRYGEFYAETASSLTINAGGDTAMRGANIYPPNGGDLTVQLIPNPAGSDNYVLKQINVLTSSTRAPNNIHIICDYAGLGGCEQIDIQAQYATGNVIVECINGGNCWESDLDSPENALGQTIINCDYGTSSDVADDICHLWRIDQRNTANDLRIHCDTSLGSRACDNSVIKCSSGDTTIDLLPDGNSQWTYSPSSIGCLQWGLPTLSPTIDPTNTPTVMPTSNPIIKSTIKTPSRPPTNLPTSQPTETTSIPTISPSDVPSVSPTSYPTVPPIEYDYHFVDISLNWADAENHCVTQCGSNLASIHSWEQFNTIQAMVVAVQSTAVAPSPYWLGLNDIVSSSDNRVSAVFRWSDGTPFDFCTDLSGGIDCWNSNNPNNYQNNPQDCVNMYDDGWNDDGCAESHPFFCNFCNSPTTEPTSQPSYQPTQQPDPTPQPSPHPTPRPTPQPTPQPTVEPDSTPEPTPQPTIQPTPEPTQIPTTDPVTSEPTAQRNYHLVNIDYNWTMAESYCQDICNSNLASVHSASDWDQLRTVLLESPLNDDYYARVWFGLNDRENEFQFEYSDGTPYNIYNYTTPGNYPWVSDSPADNSVTSYNQDCGDILRSGGWEWNDDECDETRPFVCNECNTNPPTNSPTTSEPTTVTSTTITTISPTTTSPTTTASTTISPTTSEPTPDLPGSTYPNPSEALSTLEAFNLTISDAPSTSPTKRPIREVVEVPSEDFTSTDPNMNMDGEIGVGDDDKQEPEEDDGNNEEFQNNGLMESNMIYYIIGAAAICCIVCCILVYLYSLRRKKNKDIEKMLDAAHPSRLHSTTATFNTFGTNTFTAANSVSPRSNDGMIANTYTDPSNFEFKNGLGSLSVADDVLMDDVINHMSTPMGPEPDTEQMDIFKGEQDIPGPPPAGPVHRKLKTLQSINSVQSHQSDYEIEMTDIVYTPNGDEQDQYGSINSNHQHNGIVTPQMSPIMAPIAENMAMEPIAIDDGTGTEGTDEDVAMEMDDDNDVIVPTTKGNDDDNLGRDEFVIEGDDVQINYGDNHVTQGGDNDEGDDWEYYDDDDDVLQDVHQTAGQ